MKRNAITLLYVTAGVLMTLPGQAWMWSLVPFVVAEWMFDSYRRTE